VTVKYFKSFHVHKALVCGRSSYFKKAFTSSFKEAEEGVIEFKYLQIPTFKIFMLWLYNQNIWDWEGEEHNHPAAFDIIDLYIFADMFQIPALKNDAIKLLENQIMHTGQGVPLQHLNYVWANTAGGSPLRRFLADMCARTLSPDDFDFDSKFPGNEAVFVVSLKGLRCRL
jgi:hypothetical protein